MAMASTIQPYANVKNRPFNAVAQGGLQAGDALLMQVEDQAANKQKAAMASNQGLNRSMMGPMALSVMGGFGGLGSFFP